jgi:hypothetical protein
MAKGIEEPLPEESFADSRPSHSSSLAGVQKSDHGRTVRVAEVILLKSGAPGRSFAQNPSSVE